MNVILEDLSNPVNSWVPKEGDLIGRHATCQIQIRDPKISGVHAKIEVDSAGQFVLVDQKSHNGLVISGRKVKKITLLPGIEFRMGATQFVVRAFEQSQLTPDAQEDSGTKSLIITEDETPSLGEDPKEPVEVSSIVSEIATPSQPLTIEDLSWDLRIPLLLEKFAKTSQEGPHASPMLPQAFVPPIRLKFVRGIQLGTEWDLRFAPSLLGKFSYEFALADPMAPDHLAEIVADSIGQPLIKNLCGHLVKINGNNFTTCQLHDGDVMSFGNTLIKVSFL